MEQGRHWRAVCWLLTVGLVAGSETSRSCAGADRPNIVYVMADELGYYELSCMGHPNFHTPNIDRFAAEGVRFTQMLAGSSVCAPTRCCFMTGKHSGHTSVRSNGGGTPLRVEEETVASLLKRAGYATGGFGKWGCGGRGSTGVPEKHGFDVFLGYYDQVHAHSYYPPYLIRNSEELPLTGNRGRSEGQTYSHYVIYEGALDFIREHRDQPFFCYLPITPPHGLFDIPDDDPAWQRYKDQPWPEQARRYAAMVNMVDRQLGELLTLLRELEIEDNTLVLFSGDNGGMDYFRSQEHPRGFHGPNVNPRTGVEFRGQKGRLYEGGLRIPMLARWPGKIAPGRVSDHLGYFPDFLPTACEVAGVEIPDDVDGISFLPELLGKEQPQHEFLYWEIGNQIAVRRQNWKAIKTDRNGPWELYDLSRDVSETNDVSREHVEVVRQFDQLAVQAHTPVEEGTFADTTLHERDRQAKFGFDRPSRQSAVHRLPTEGLISNENWKLVRVSSEARGNGKLASRAFDGDPRTWWHTQFSPELKRPPHELVVDLGGEFEIRGFRLLARQDGGFNGTVKGFELYVSSDPEDFGKPVVRGEGQRVKTPQEVTCDTVRGRYVRFVALSEVNDGPWASLAELGVIGKSVDQ